MKKQMKHLWKQLLCWTLCLSIIAPSMSPLAAEAATAISNKPRSVDFSRPEALSLEDLQLASSSDADTAVGESVEHVDHSGQDAPKNSASDSLHVETDSNAELREPEAFYEPVIEEPDGELVQFNDHYRTYRIGEGEYISVMGGYSGLYKDEDGMVRVIDNTLTAVSAESDRKEPEEEERNDESGTEQASAAASGTIIEGAKNMARAARQSKEKATVTYQNEAGALSVSLPETMAAERGIRLEADGHTIELIPQSGDFKHSITVENAIRYNDVYPGIDYQYTVLGDTVKEDIILMEPGKRHSFTYQLEPGGLKASKVQNRIVLYEKSQEAPAFVLNAPVMKDAAGEMSFDITISLKKQENGPHLVTITADEEWLSDKARVYPVRIDPSLTKGPSEFKVISVASGRPGVNFGWTMPPYVGYDDGILSGNSPAYGNTRTYISLGIEEEVWNDIPRDQEIVKATFTIGQQTGWGSGASEFALEAPNENWSIATSWDQQAGVTFTRLGTQPSPGKDGIFTFDITETMKEWLAGTRVQIGLSMRAVVEPGVDTSEEGRQSRLRSSIIRMTSPMAHA